MREAHQQHQAVRTHEIPHISADPPPGGRTVSRIYDRQRAFQRDIHHRERQGWKLIGTRHQPAGISLEMIRASAPGALLHGQQDRVVAYYACVSEDGNRSSRPLASTIGHLSYQTRLATSAWLERLAHAIQPHCYPEP